MLAVSVFLAWAIVAPVEGALLRRHKRHHKSKAKMWKPCGVENGMISDGGLVRFGFGLTWVESEVPHGATCAISTFGTDPSPGIMKMCECSGAAPAQGAHRQVRDDMGLLWTRCADEGGDCKCDSGTVRFGTAARWVVAENGASKGSKVSCAPAAFGGNDPALAQKKECWCQDPSATAAAPVSNPTVAIVLLSRRAPDLKTWLQYHLGYMGVQHVFMDVEDSPHFDEAFQSLSKGQQERLTVWKAASTGSGSDARPVDDYTTLQARQLKAMSEAKAASKEMGIEWLIHIDDDELLYAPLHRSIGQILASVPQGFDQAYIPNVEAIYDSADVKSCFTETKNVNMNRYTFVSYANGKSAVRVSNNDAVPAGPHQWRTPQGLEISAIHLDAETFGSPLWLLHYESCPFTRWEDKYWELGNTSPDKVQSIPFRFYKDSISRMQRCRMRSEAGQSFLENGDDECSEANLKDLWSRWKTRQNPAIRDVDLMPISIPWDKVQGMSF